LGLMILVRLCASLGLLVLAWPCVGDILPLGNVTVRSGPDVDAYISAGTDGVYISFPGTQRWELSGCAQDYHGMPPEEVMEALTEIRYPIQGLDIEILVLPVPRTRVPESSAEGRVVFLAPGRISYPREHVHYVVAHEIGHVVQHLLMPDSRRDLWRAYGALRGLDLECQDGPVGHAWRPAELFAEDFRVLFGGESARCGGNVENHEITGPEDVEGLREFMLSLLDEWETVTRVSAYPNPFQSDVVVEAFSLADHHRSLEVTVFDIQGRKVRDLRASSSGPVYLVWDGRDQMGETVSSGVYLVSIHAGGASYVRKLIKR
jgi:hypothetical protein